MGEGGSGRKAEMPAAPSRPAAPFRRLTPFPRATDRCTPQPYHSLTRSLGKCIRPAAVTDRTVFSGNALNFPHRQSIKGPIG
jgi:hypothetical protein